RYPGSDIKHATVGPALVELTASEIWSVLRVLALPPLLWNVIPFHPHEPGNPFTNRKITARELQKVDLLNETLIRWLG
ncbi:uracil-DNA glycosylase, partial [Pseudomonas syringae pv. tagetis]